MRKGSKYWQLNDKEWLYQKYWVEKLSRREIAKIIGCSAPTVSKALKRFNIPLRPAFGAWKGKHRSEETKAKISEANSNPSEETRQKMRDARIGKTPGNKGKKGYFSHTEEAKAKIKEARKHRIFPTIDTKPELIFIEFYNNFGIADRIEDTRNNSFHIGRLNPDFIIRDKRIAIFINGDYWHSALLRPKLKYTQRPENQIKICKQHKWKAIIIWESDLLREDTKQFILSILRKEKVISL